MAKYLKIYISITQFEILIGSGKLNTTTKKITVSVQTWYVITTILEDTY